MTQIETLTNGTEVELLTGLNRGHIGTITGVATSTEGGRPIYLVHIPTSRNNKCPRTVRCSNVHEVAR